MNKLDKLIGVIAFGFVLCSLTACEESSPVTRLPEKDPYGNSWPMRLEMVQGDSVERGSVEVVMNLYKQKDHAGPRVMELTLKHSPSLKYISAIAGEALQQAGKQLIVQTPGSDRVRAVAYSSISLQDIDTGTLLSLRFERKEPGKATVEILTEKPIFAPAAANQGLIVSDPLVLGDKS